MPIGSGRIGGAGVKATPGLKGPHRGIPWRSPALNSKIPVQYAFVADVGTFTETGNASGFSVSFPAGSGAFAATGNAASIALGETLASGTFLEIGNPAGFRLGFPLGSGSFAETGYSAGFNVSFRLGSGSFAETGNAASIAIGENLASGTFIETGNAAGFGIGFLAQSGSFVETGFAAGFALSGAPVHYSFNLATGVFTLAGYPANIDYVAPDRGLATGSFIWPKFPEGYSTLRVTTVKKAFGPPNWEAFLQLANVRCADDYGYKGLISQTLTDAVPVLDPLTGRLAIDFLVNDGRAFMVDLPDDMRGIYRGVLRQMTP